VEALADAVRLRALHLRLRVIDVVDRQEELVGMLVQTAAALRFTIRQSQHSTAVRFEERQHAIFEQICRRLRRVLRGQGHLRVRVDERLLIDPPNALIVPT
jgi:hypothetical protein